MPVVLENARKIMNWGEIQFTRIKKQTRLPPSGASRDFLVFLPVYS
jgi:hypothetical protein